MLNPSGGWKERNKQQDWRSRLSKPASGAPAVPLQDDPPAPLMPQRQGGGPASSPMAQGQGLQPITGRPASEQIQALSQVSTPCPESLQVLAIRTGVVLGCRTDVRRGFWISLGRSPVVGLAPFCHARRGSHTQTAPIEISLTACKSCLVCGKKNLGSPPPSSHPSPCGSRPLAATPLPRSSPRGRPWTTPRPLTVA